MIKKEMTTKRVALKSIHFRAATNLENSTYLIKQIVIIVK